MIKLFEKLARNKKAILKIYSIVFIILIIVVSIQANKIKSFFPIGDNMTYLMGSESIFYDRDIKIQKKDFNRLINKYENIPLNLVAVIGKPDLNGNYYVAKPIFFMVYLSLFTPIEDPLLRATISNSLLLIFLNLFFCFLLSKIIRSISSTRLIITLLIFTLMASLSQTFFYISELHPELFFNTIIILASFPLLYDLKKRKKLYILFGLLGSLVFSEKQIALVFPITSMVYLFFKDKSAFYYYICGFIVGILSILLTYQLIYGTFTPYDGLRGRIKFIEESVNFKLHYSDKIFSIPFNYSQRFIEYFFGRNIGLFTYNAYSLFFVYISFYSIFKKYYYESLKFFPVLAYVGAYFLLVNPFYSYGGATSIGNRYYFQIYFYVLILSVYFFTIYWKEIKSNVRKITYVIFPLITLWLFFVFSHFFLDYSTALPRHIYIAENNWLLSKLPIELSYSKIIYQDLHQINRFDNFILINSGYPIKVEGEERHITQDNSYVIEKSENSEMYLDKESKFRKISQYKMTSLFLEPGYVALYKTSCNSHEICYGFKVEE